MPKGLSGLERHRDQARDQTRDHETKTEFGLAEIAEHFLEMVSQGDERAVALAHDLVRGILEQPVIQRALALDELLRTRSPFALMRAVELAEMVGVMADGGEGIDGADGAGRSGAR